MPEQTDDEKRAEWAASFSRVAWTLYMDHGFADFPNWVSMKHDCIKREEVVAALRRPEIRAGAINAISTFGRKIDEICGLLKEAETIP